MLVLFSPHDPKVMPRNPTIKSALLARGTEPMKKRKMRVPLAALDDVQKPLDDSIITTKGHFRSLHFLSLSTPEATQLIDWSHENPSL